MNGFSRYLLSTLLLLLAGIASAEIETVTWLHTDHLGSPLMARDAQGNTLWQEDYSPWGERLAAPTANSADIGYTGHYEEADIGLTYAQARWYDPAVGRFLSADPVGIEELGPEYFHRYSYVTNNPYKYTDPDGRMRRPSRPGMENGCTEGYCRGWSGGGNRFSGGRPANGGEILSPQGVRPGSGGSRTSNKLGKEGEAAATRLTGVGKNTQKFVVNGRTRIPDQVSASNISTRQPLKVTEVKNVKYQSFTRQLRDDVDLVGPGGVVEIFVRTTTRVSGPLMRAHLNPTSPIMLRPLL